MNRSFKIGVIVLALLFAVLAQSSQKQALLERKRKLEKEIELATQLLKETRKKRTVSVEELKILKSRINKRDQLIREYQKSIEEIDSDIQVRSKRLSSYQADLNKVKSEYAKLIYFAFKNQNQSLDLMYILASEDINQIYSRMKYLQQYKDYRLKNIQLIIKLKRIIEVEIVELTQRREVKAKFLNSVLAEKATLLQDKGKVNSVVRKLKQSEEGIEEDIRQKKKLTEKLDKQIAAIIAKESKKNSYGNLTPEDRLISDDFKTNKGRLPWPTAQGIITDKFGEHPHPTIRDLMIRNNGIDISTVNKAEARVVFSGEVSKVFSIKGANSTVIVRHGNYYSVYHNLKEVKVRAGEVVKTKQALGTVFTDHDSGKTVLHFEIWEEMNKKNPEDWLTN